MDIVQYYNVELTISWPNLISVTTASTIAATTNDGNKFGDYMAEWIGMFIPNEKVTG